MCGLKVGQLDGVLYDVKALRLEGSDEFLSSRQRADIIHGGVLEELFTK